MTGILNLLVGAVSSVVKDTYFNLVSLLLPGDGTNGAQNNTFLDSSTNNFSITRNGNTTQGTFSPFSQTGWGNFFDGTADYLTAAGANLALGTGDFTIEFWFYANAYSITTDSSAMFDSRSGNNTTGFQIGPVFNAVDKLTVGQNTSPIITSSTTYPLNTWVHCAVVRSSGTIVLYQNGVNVGSVANTTNNSTTTNYIGSGHWQPTAAGATFNGYLSNFRISNTARYTSGFTPSTTPFSSDANTRLLACQSNRFADSSSNGYTITPFGTPSIQAFSPFAPTAAYSAATVGGSGYFDGSGDYLTLPSNSAFSYGTSDYSQEFWIYLTTSPATFQRPLQYSDDRDNIVVESSNFNFYDGTASTISAATTGQWFHLCVTRVGGTLRGFVNGKLGFTRSGTYNSSTRSLALGATSGGSNPLGGYTANYRIVKGGIPTVYSTSSTTVGDQIFTPPTAPFTGSENLTAGSLSLLCNFTNAGITDATAKNDLETVGNAQISTTQSKFGGSSMYFDGTGDYLSLPVSKSFEFGSANWTIEFWLYVPSLPSTRKELLYLNANSSGYAAVALHICSTNKLGLSFSESGGSWRTDDATGVGSSLTAATWQYVAVTRSGQNIQIYLDGTAQGSAYTTTAATTSLMTTYTLNQIATYNTSFYQFDGYMDELRITIGQARTVTSVPTAAFPTQ